MPADLGTLGREVRLRPARRGPRPPVLLLALVVLVAAGFARFGDDGDQRLLPVPDDGATTAGAVADGSADAASGGASGVEGEGGGRLQVAPEVAAAGQLRLGTAGPVELFVPGIDPVLVSFHEAAYAEAMAIAPSGQVTENENPTRFQPPAEAADDSVGFHVQVSRGRANAATSAVDVVLREDTPVLSPVTGTVVEVKPYKLYGAHDDVRLELRPDAAPEHAVVLIHISGLRVQAGDRVVVGDVLADQARLFPFEGVVDREFAPERHGHVHLEVKVADAG